MPRNYRPVGTVTGLELLFGFLFGLLVKSIEIESAHNNTSFCFFSSYAEKEGVMQKLIKIIACFSACVCLASCKSGYTGLKTPLTGAQPEEKTVSDSGIAARQGDWIYYINGDNFTREENGRFHEYAGALCRMRADGSDKQVVVDRDVSLFNIRGEEIFLCVYENNGSVAAKALIDGTGYKTLCKIDDIYHGGCYAFGGDYIYYTKDYRLYRMDRSGENKKRITEFKIYNLRVNGERVFFTREENENIGSVFTLKDGEIVQVTKSAAYVLLITDTNVYYYLLDNGTVYRYGVESGEHKAIIYGGYTEYCFDEESGLNVFSISQDDSGEGGGIFVNGADGGEKTKVSENSGRCMAVYEGYIYYINTSKLNKLYRCAIDGSVDECLDEEYIFDYDTLDILDGFVYFFSEDDYSRVYRVNCETKKTECVELEEFSDIG